MPLIGERFMDQVLNWQFNSVAGDGSSVTRRMIWAVPAGESHFELYFGDVGVASVQLAGVTADVAPADPAPVAEESAGGTGAAAQWPSPDTDTDTADRPTGRYAARPSGTCRARTGRPGTGDARHAGAGSVNVPAGGTGRDRLEWHLVSRQRGGRATARR